MSNSTLPGLITCMLTFGNETDQGPPFPLMPVCIWGWGGVSGALQQTHNSRWNWCDPPERVRGHIDSIKSINNQ